MAAQYSRADLDRYNRAKARGDTKTMQALDQRFGGMLSKRTADLASRAKDPKAALSKDQKGLLNDFAGAGTIADELGVYDDLPQLDNSKLETQLDPKSDQYIGKRSGETQDILDRGKSLLTIMEGGLSGLNSDENRALRETARREVNNAYSGEVEAMARAQARSGVRGAASTAQLANKQKEYRDTIANQENDQLIKNIDVQDRRRNDYGTAVGNQSTMLRNAEGDEYGKVKDTSLLLDKRQGTNLDQANNSRASRLSALTGILGYDLSKRSAKDQREIAEKQMKRSGSGGGGNSTALYDASKNILSRFGGVDPSEFGL